MKITFLASNKKQKNTSPLCCPAKFVKCYLSKCNKEHNCPSAQSGYRIEKTHIILSFRFKNFSVINTFLIQRNQIITCIPGLKPYASIYNKYIKVCNMIFYSQKPGKCFLSNMYLSFSQHYFHCLTKRAGCKPAIINPIWQKTSIEKCFIWTCRKHAIGNYFRNIA